MNDDEHYEALAERLSPLVTEEKRLNIKGLATHTEQVLDCAYGAGCNRHALFSVISEMISGMEEMEALELYSVRFDCQTDGYFTGRYTECEEWIEQETTNRFTAIDEPAYVIDNATPDEVAAWRQARVEAQAQS